jgi:hypothetical protein
MNAPVIHLPLLIALGILPVLFHVTKTDWQKLVLKSKSETPGIKLPWQLPHSLSTVKTLFKWWVHNCSISWVRSGDYKPSTAQVHKSPKAVSILSQINTIHIHLNVILPICLMHAISRPPHLPFDDTNNIWWRIQVVKLLITCLPPASCYGR